MSENELEIILVVRDPKTREEFYSSAICMDRSDNYIGLGQVIAIMNAEAARKVFTPQEMLGFQLAAAQQHSTLPPETIEAMGKLWKTKAPTVGPTDLGQTLQIPEGMVQVPIGEPEVSDDGHASKQDWVLVDPDKYKGHWVEGEPVPTFQFEDPDVGRPWNGARMTLDDVARIIRAPKQHREGALERAHWVRGMHFKRLQEHKDHEHWTSQVDPIGWAGPGLFSFRNSAGRVVRMSIEEAKDIINEPGKFRDAYPMTLAWAQYLLGRKDVLEEGFGKDRLDEVWGPEGNRTSEVDSAGGKDG